MCRSAEEFKTAAKEKKIEKVPSHDCSICGYTVGYIIDVSGEVYFDAGCDCTSTVSITQRSWEDVAEQYNMQTNPEVIARMDEFWGFTEEELCNT